jgi:hypothetical protein
MPTLALRIWVGLASRDNLTSCEHNPGHIHLVLPTTRYLGQCICCLVAVTRVRSASILLAVNVDKEVGDSSRHTTAP